MYELIILISYFLIFGFIVFNIMPFTTDVFNHYLRTKTTVYVNGYKDCFGTYHIFSRPHIDVIKEPCNPWLFWWQTITHLPLVKMKPNEKEYVFENDEIEELWRRIHND